MFRRKLTPAAAASLFPLFAAACGGQTDSADSDAPAEEAFDRAIKAARPIIDREFRAAAERVIRARS